MKSILLAFVVGLFALISTCESQTITLSGLGWSYGYVEVPSLEPTLTFSATNYTSTGLVELFIKYLSPPTSTSFDSMTGLTNLGESGLWSSVTFPGGIKPDAPYYFALHNESVIPQTVYITSNFGPVTVVPEPGVGNLFLLAVIFVIMLGLALPRHA